MKCCKGRGGSKSFPTDLSMAMSSATARSPCAPQQSGKTAMTTETASPALLKDILGPQALQTIADAGIAASPQFDRAAFLRAASDGLDALSIMERVRHIANALHAALPGDYAAALSTIRAMAPHLNHGFQAMAVTEYVARQGLDDFDLSMDALADLTRFGSAEFAIRPFLAVDTPRALATMMRWTASEDEHVRRLASEGARPRLPWAARVPALKADPTLAAPILEALKADPALYVRKSVANHLNDIAKDRPEWLLARLAEWPQGTHRLDHPPCAADADQERRPRRARADRRRPWRRVERPRFRHIARQRAAGRPDRHHRQAVVGIIR